MKKATYIIEKSKSGNAYQLVLKRCKLKFTMSFNDWLNFLDILLAKTKASDFDLWRLFTGMHAFLVLFERGFVVETSDPHVLHVYAKAVYEDAVKRCLERYQPKYNEMTMFPVENGMGWSRQPEQSRA